MAKTLALGSILRVENPATAGYITIGNINNFGVPSPVKSEVDVTDFDSTAREKLTTLPDNGQTTFSGFLNLDGAGQALMFTDAHDPDAPVRGFQIDLTRQDYQLDFDASVLSFEMTAPGPDQAYGFTLTLTVSGAVTPTTPIPA